MDLEFFLDGGKNDECVKALSGSHTASPRVQILHHIAFDSSRLPVHLVFDEGSRCDSGGMLKRQKESAVNLDSSVQWKVRAGEPAEGSFANVPTDTFPHRPPISSLLLFPDGPPDLRGPFSLNPPNPNPTRT